MEKIKVITVRLPESLHNRIREAAHNGGPDSSMNSWCIKAITTVLDIQEALKTAPTLSQEAENAQ